MESKKQRRGCFGCAFRAIGIIAGLFLLVAVVGCVFERQTAASNRENYPPQGELVTVNDRQMHIHCEGEGSPTVVLDAGQGGWSIAWGKVMPELSASTRVCAYDRAGYGWSDATDDGRTPQDIADDLTALLDAAGVDGPLVPVGFSYTGLSTRLFAAQHPDVVGMVLVDPTTEFDNDLMDETLRAQQQSTIGVFQFFGLLAQVGAVRIMDPMSMAPSAPFIPENAVAPENYYSFVAEAMWWETSTKEFANRLNDEVLANVRDNGAIQEMPLVIIGAETVDEAGGFEELNAQHLAKLQELAGRSSQGDYVLAENSTHEVPSDRPDVVIAAIEQVIGAVSGR